MAAGSSTADTAAAVTPALTPDELAALAADVVAQREADRVKYDQPPEPGALDVAQALHDEELGDARLFCSLYRGRRVFDLAAGQWYRWAGHYWEEHGSALADVERVVDLYKGEADAAAVRARKKAAANAEKSEESKDEKDRKALLKRIRDLSKKQRQKNVLDLAAGGEAGFGTSFDRLAIRGDEWGSKTGLLACANGVIELLREEPYYRFRDGRPEDYIKAAAPTEWQGLDAPAIRWEQFHGEVFEDHPDVVPFVQRLIGYGMAGDPIENLFVILWGEGRNGKGTLVDTLGRVFGENVVGRVKTGLFLKGKETHPSGQRSDLMRLRGLRLAVASETNEGKHVDTAEMKLLTGGDPITARPPYGKKDIQFNPSFTLLQLTNHKPGLDAMDAAAWDRALLIPFTRRFLKPDAEEWGENVRPQNERLREELLREGPGIIAWAVRGWCDYAARAAAQRGAGLAPPDVVRQTTREYRAEQDVEGRFLRECCEEVEGASVKAGDLRAAFNEWCDNNGIRHGKVGRLTALVRERHEPGRPTRRGTFYPGLRLLSEREEA